MFTHLGRDAGLFNYSPSACHQSCGLFQADPATACPPQGCRKRSGFTSAAAFFLSLSASQGIPQSSYAGDTSTVSHLPLPERARRTLHEPQTQDGASLQATESPGSRRPAGASFFLLLLPLAPPPSSMPSCSSAFLFFLFLSVLPTASDPGLLGPSRLLLFFFSPCSRLWLQPLQAGSPKTHGSLTMNNQYRY